VGRALMGRASASGTLCSCGLGKSLDRLSSRFEHRERLNRFDHRGGFFERRGRAVDLRGRLLDVKNLSFSDKRRPERIPRHANVKSTTTRSDQLKAMSIMCLVFYICRNGKRA
jgi:hypothetical protein